MTQVTSKASDQSQQLLAHLKSHFSVTAHVDRIMYRFIEQDESGLIKIHTDLRSEMKAKQKSIDAHRIVIADFQKSLAEANLQLGKTDPITRNRSTLAKLLQETFSIRIGFVSINIQKFCQLIRFTYRKSEHNF